MKQTYHSNATTNLHIREQINNSNLNNYQLAQKYNISQNTVSKWKKRKDFKDRSSKPNTIKYSLTELEKHLILHIRLFTWWKLDDIWDILLGVNSKISRSSVYRTLRAKDISRVPEKQKNKAKKFKEYEPGYLHIDVTYLPKIKGVKYYLFVAIDRCTRALYYKVYDKKTSFNAEGFMNECLEFFPFGITHVLTDNGLEFTNRLIKSKKGIYCTKPSKLDDICKNNNIKHRLTKPGTPATNGMVERVNGTIKNDTVKINQYADLEQMNYDLMNFIVYYNTERRHGSLRKELNVKTPYEAIKRWYEIKNEIFNQKPEEFLKKILSLKTKIKASYKQQPCET